MSADKDEPFLSRWARQKRAASAPVPEASAQAVAPEEPVDVAKLPRIEDLTADSDITAFLRKGVPEALQRLALRRMWSLDPAIRDFVEIAENQWDFNAPGGIHGLYQAIEEGTDVSVWLAQATQSVIAPPPQPEKALETPAAAQQVEVSQPLARDPIAEPPSPLGEVHVVQADDQAAEKRPESNSPALRRRHGTALPE